MFRAMATVRLSQSIGAPSERVWEIICDLDGAPQRLSRIVAIEHLSGPKFGVGTRWRETRIMFGREATEELAVASIDPGRAYTAVAESHRTKYHSELRIESRAEEASVLTMTFSAEAQSLGTKVMAATIGRLFRRATKKALAQDLAEIAAAAESSPDA